MLDMVFNKIYVVWGQDPLKKQYITNHFKKHNIDNYEFVRSLTPENFFHKNKSERFKFTREQWVLHKCKRQGTHIPMSFGEIACAYGHLKAYKTALNQGVDNFLVIEDDVRFNAEMLSATLDWKDYIPMDWDIIHFHSWRDYNTSPESKKRKKVNKYFYTGYIEFSGAVCYALTAATAKQLLTRFYPIQVAADGAIALFSTTNFARKFYKAYVIKPFLAEKTVFDSQIDEEKIIHSKYKTRQQRYKMHSS